METTRETDGGLTAEARIVSTELEASCGYSDSGVTKTEASGRPSFEAIHHLYQAAQHAVHKEYQG